jgi:hypothetical protein
MANEIEIEVERPGAGAAVLTPNAPERRSALPVAMAGELAAACEELGEHALVELGERA